HEQVVHHAEPRRAERLPGPVDRREADGPAPVVARDQLDAVVRVRDQVAGEREELLVGGGDLVEVAVPAHQRQQGVEVGLGHGRDHEADPNVLASRPVSEATDKMREEGLPEIAIDTFAHYEKLLREGDPGLLPEDELEPLDDVQGSDDLPDGDPADLERVVVLKLNGGLGTSMGMTKAKSLL